MKLSPTLSQRFRDKCGRRTNEGCIPWAGSITNAGYGVMSIATGIVRGAHVVAWFLKHGRWPEGILRHTCDHKRCVNTDHMVEGTHSQNHQDAFERGFRRHGEQHWFSRLTDAQANAIRQRRAAGERSVDLAREFGVHVDTIWRISSGRQRRYSA